MVPSLDLYSKRALLPSPAFLFASRIPPPLVDFAAATAGTAAVIALVGLDLVWLAFILVCNGRSYI